MQKWQERARQKAHTHMVIQAKPTIKRYSKSRQKAPLNQSRSKIQTSPIPNLPFNQVIQIFQLTKYEHLLVEYGFPQKIKQKQSLNYIDQMVTKVDEEDQQRFLSLMNALLAISNELKINYKRTPIIKKNNNKMYPPPPSISANSTSGNLKKSGSNSTKRQDRTPPINFRIKNKMPLNQNNLFSVYETPITKTSSKISTKTIKKLGMAAKDDFSIIHQFKNKNKCKPALISNSNNFIKRLSDKLKQYEKNGEKRNFQQQQTILYYNKVKQMYLSFDNATLTSNIANIDLEQIIECFATEIYLRLDQSMSITDKNKNDLNVLKKIKQKEISKLIKQSLIFVKDENPQKQINEEINVEQNIEETISIGNSSESQSQDSDQNMFDYQLQSFATDLTCFDTRYDQQKDKIQQKDIKNFIQLAVMAGKMQKQSPIIAYSYLIKIMNASKTNRLTLRNWKNLTLITLIVASKIWDDQSLENNSFSKVINPYTTLEINRLERHLLALLNYKLKIEPKQYCLSYFTLRKHAIKAGKTANLMNLNLQMIKKLQSGVKKVQSKTKAMHKKKLNQSF